MAAAPRRLMLSNINDQKVVVIVQMITHLNEQGPERTEIFLVGGNSVVVRGTIEEIAQAGWP